MKQGKHVDQYGGIVYYKDSLVHRDNDQPAIVCSEGMAWYQNDKRHRLAGPAEIYLSGEKGYYINGKYFTPEEHANHPEVKKYRLQQILNRMVKE
jgi:hypothetical protein